MEQFKFGDIIFVNLGVNTGSEQNKTRPCVVIIDNEDKLVIIPIASKIKSQVTHVSLSESDVYLPSKIGEPKVVIGTILCEHIRTVHKEDVISEVCCYLKEGTKRFLSKCLKKSFGLESYYSHMNSDDKSEKIFSMEELDKNEMTLSVNSLKKTYQRGEIIQVNFGETRLFNGLVDCLVISPNYANQNNNTVIVIPLINEVEVTNEVAIKNNYFLLKSSNEKDLSIEGVKNIDFGMIRSIDKERIIKSYGKVSDKTLLLIDIFFEKKYPVKVLTEYKILQGVIKKENVKDFIIL